MHSSPFSALWLSFKFFATHTFTSQRVSSRSVLFSKGWSLSGAIFLGILVTQISCQAVKEAGTKLGGGLPVVLNVETISIADLEKITTQDTTVYLKGTIGKQAPILQGAVYELRDSTGSIWVRVQGAGPNPGDRVTIKGITRYQPIDQNGQQQRSLFVDQQDLLQTQPPAKS